jgi:ubiquinone/menaquinone biosynthesis C-methylase UbiE
MIGRLGRWYRSLEYAAFGRALERRRFAFLHRLAGARQILILGEGDGRALKRLLAIAPDAHCDVVEISSEMIALAQRRIGCSDRVTFLCSDARAFEWPTSHYDAIVTLFFLDCFTPSDAHALIRSLVGALIPGGAWLIGEFAIPESGWRRLHARIWIWTMYRFFRLATCLQTTFLPPIEDLMRKAGMERIEYEKERAGLMISEVWIKPAWRKPG